MVRDPLHIYFGKIRPPADSPSIFAGVLGHKQVTDAYLLRIAHAHRARFLTFDYRLREVQNVELLA